INLANRAGLLQVGTNILAIHGLNSSASDGDLLVLPELANVVVSGWVEHFFGTPTPEAANSSNFIAHVSDTKFSVDRGFYDTAFAVAITCSTPSSSIYYTTNGSAPSTSNGTRYTVPVGINTTTTLRAVAVRSGWTSSDIDTETYIFLDDVLTQVRPAGYPTSWGAGVADYDMDPNVVNNPAYADTLKEDLLAVPTMSIVMNVNDMFGPSGIYSNTYAEGDAWERACSVEYIYADGTTGFQENAGIRIYGGVGRDPAYRKHSLRLVFRDIYGDTKLNYEFFEDSPVDQFDTLILRSNFNDAWHGSLGSQSQYMRDRWASEAQLAMGQPSSHGNWVHLYINGIYWGLYNPVERPDATFAASYLGGDKADYDAINSYPQEPIAGDSVAWNAMMSLANAGLTTDAQYQAIQQYVDVVNLADYVLLNHYLSNWDWDDHNWYAARKREPGATFKFFSWDAEWVMYNGVLTSDYTGTNRADRPSHLFAQLMGNAEFKMLFADRVYKWCFNDGVLTPAAGQALWMQIAGEIDRAVVAESARWGDAQREPPYTRDGDWIPEQNWVMNTWFPARTNTLLTQYRNKNWYPSAAAPTFSKHGGVVQAGYKLTMTGSGTIYYTTDGTDPRLYGGTVSPGAQAYTSSGVIISDSKVIRARVLYNGVWSALHEAVFYIDASPGLRVTEIMYNPAAPTLAEMSLGFTDRDDFEYIELQNIGATTINLFGVRFGAGVDATLPTAYINPGQYGLLVRNQGAFEARYGTGLSGLIVGTYDGRLDDGGEALRLEYAVGGIIQEFTYKDGWYDQTDGQGFSLVIRDPLADRALWDAKDGWKASWAFGGNPGAGDTGYAPGSIIISELLAHSDAIDGDWIELYNT
ncbi:MAG: CotH kinase family protein, partial [Acidobacteria bacterium]|nr:CotH kinase family protein [Acidobacteriota bacterium]